MDKLLNSYRMAKEHFDQYGNELESIRVQIEYRLTTQFPNGIYENDQWVVRLIPEGERRAVINCLIIIAIAISEYYI